MKKFLVIGNPIEHSLSPKLQNYWIKSNNLNAIYGKLEVHESDLAELMLAAAQGDLSDKEVKLRDDAALCVVMASKGYPEGYEKGSIIGKVKEAQAIDDVMVFHAGTSANEQGEFTAIGGRVLGVTARGKTIKEAQERAYQAVDTIEWPEGFCRRDIGWRAIA